MNHTKLKNYAPQARRDFIQAMTDRAAYYGVTATKTEPVVERGDVAVIGGREFPLAVARRRNRLVERIKLDGFDHTMEALAYTWFNRFVAIRYMELHSYLDHGYRVLSHPEGKPTPEILQYAEHVDLPGLKRETVIDLKLDGNKEAELYRLLLTAQCNALNQAMPFLFERIDDETELLLPDNLLNSDSLIKALVSNLDAEDCETVEVLGWLYQFYIADKKDEVMARKSAVPTEDIPAVTQLFTPHWIVRYLVENSLGRLWLLNRPGSRLRQHMPYYIEGEATEPPAWEEDWLHRIHYNEDDYQTWMWVRPNRRLQGNLDATLWYALTIGGYAYGQSRWGIESLDGSGWAKVKEIEQAAWENASFEDLRYCLFLIQRSFKWDGRSEETEGMFHACHAALCKAWDREWRQHTSQLPDLSIVGVSCDIQSETDFLNITKPEEIRVCDPAVGSGHMLTYAFDLLTRIYEEEGYAPTEIPALILRHNLHGLEICPRAAQLAELALIFKAREKSRRFFQPEHLVRPRIIELRDIRFAENELRDYIHALGLGDLFNQPMLRLLHQFEEAKNFGSLIQPCLDERAIADARRAIEAKDLGGQLFLRETQLKVLRVLEQAEALTQRYHVVVANPPYMGVRNMNPKLKDFLTVHFPNARTDLFACFFLRCIGITAERGRLGFMSPFVWMFLSSYEKLRLQLTSESSITSLIQLEYSGFDGATVPICAFTLCKASLPEYRGSYIRLSAFRGASNQSPKALEAIQNPSCGWFYKAATTDFHKIPGVPIAYWVSENVRSAFQNQPALATLAFPRQGNTTTDNARFVRAWFEVSRTKISFGCASANARDQEGTKWVPYNKGGGARKWFGLNEAVVNWEHNGLEIKSIPHSVVANERLYFREGLTWSTVKTVKCGFRFFGNGFIFDNKGACLFSEPSDLAYFCALLNSEVFMTILGYINPSIAMQPGDVGKMPVLTSIAGRPEAEANARAAIDISKADWDNFETSWDFRDQPLLRPGLTGATLEASWRNWEAQSTAAIRRMQELETENNRLFINAYGLAGELQPEVPEAQITLARADARRDMAAFLSYAVGCMMGRYSPDHPGLILANAGDTLREFLGKVGKPLAELAFAPDEDGIIPLLDGEWFEDDIVARTRDFLRATFGEPTLRENLRFLEDSLGKDLRKYFLTDFYKDHLQIYKKRPIYWLFSSGKQRAFQCLVYLHRYTEGTLARMRTEYAIPLQGRIASRIEQLDGDKLKATSTSHRNKLQKEQDDLKKKQAELLTFEEKLKHAADQKIALDLDDGVKVNYGKFGDLLAESKAITGGKDDE